MNRHKLAIVSALALSFSPGARASDFACLKALIPATDQSWVHKHRKQYSVPEVSDTGAGLAIGEWDQGALIHVYLYTEKSAKRFSAVHVGSDETATALQALTSEWLRDHTLEVKLENLEVFHLHLAKPGTLKKLSTYQPPVNRYTKAPTELGGWLVEDETDADLHGPIREEIAKRQAWARANNLSSDLFKAWTKARKVCPK